MGPLFFIALQVGHRFFCLTFIFKTSYNEIAEHCIFRRPKIIFFFALSNLDANSQGTVMVNRIIFQLSLPYLGSLNLTFIIVVHRFTINRKSSYFLPLTYLVH